MKKNRHIILLLIFAFGSISLFAQVSCDTINQKLHFKKTGYWEKKKLNGTIEWQGYYIKGKRNGYWKFYSKEGKTYYQGMLVDGKRNGWWYLTSSDDNTKLDGTNWIKGKCVGHATMSW